MTTQNASPADRAILDRIKEIVGAIEPRARAILYDTGAVVSPFVVSDEEWRSPCSRVSPFHQNVEREGIQLSGPILEYEPLPEGMMVEARDELARRWLGEAWEALADAEYLAEGGRWGTCVNRLYYAAFARPGTDP